MRCTVEPQARLAIIKFDAGEISCVATNWVHSVRPLCTSCQVLARPKEPNHSLGKDRRRSPGRTADLGRLLSPSATRQSCSEEAQ
jgi:hypothetical protein